MYPDLDRIEALRHDAAVRRLAAGTRPSRGRKPRSLLRRSDVRGDR